jgi:hypothetical protein
MPLRRSVGSFVLVSVLLLAVAFVPPAAAADTSDDDVAGIAAVGTDSAESPAATAEAEQKGRSEDRKERWQLQFGGFLPAFSTKLRVDSKVLPDHPGTEIDIEEDLKLDKRQRIYRLDATWRHTRKSSFGFTYYTFSRGATATLEQDVEFEDVTFPAGSGVATDSDTTLLIVKYVRSLQKTDRSELSAQIGIDYLRTAIKLTGTGGSLLAESTSVSAPLPVIGLSGTHMLSPQWRVGGEFAGLAISIGDYSGSWYDLGATIEYFPREGVAIGLGVSSFRTKLEADTEKLLGELEYKYTGPRFFVSGYF